jgi:O-antigen/teichoic acid export membrane protein
MRLSVEFAIGQGFGQAAGMLSGLIYVRLMPIEQYALYAMGLSCLAFVSIGSDLGLTSSLSYFWRESGGSKLEQKIAAVLKLRSVFLVLASVVSGVLLLKTANKQNLALATVLACFGLVVATAWSQTRTTVDLQLIRLEGRQRQSYYCEAAGSLARLLAAGAMIATGMSTALFGLAGGLLGSLSILGALRIIARVPGNRSQVVEHETWRAVIRYIAPMFPTMVVYMMQDPLVLWLALTFGGKASLSETFALGRIGAVFALLGNFVIAVVAPRLARISDDLHFARMAGLFLIVLVLLCVGATIVAEFAPSALLLLIGPRYAHLQSEVVLSIGTASFGVLLTFVATANRLRGWVRLEPLFAALQTVSIFVLAAQWSFRDSSSVLKLMVVLTGCHFFWFFLTSIVGLLVPRLVKIH